MEKNQDYPSMLSMKSYLLILSSLFIFNGIYGTRPLAITVSELNQPLRAGAAINKITPPAGSIMGNSYGKEICEGVHDDIYARTIVFEKDGVRAAFIALDLISIPHRIVVETRDLISRITGIPAGNIIMSATHCHAGPQMNPLFWDAAGGEAKRKSMEYVNNLPAMIAESVQKAETKLQPVRVSFGSVSEMSVNFNRRYLMKDGTFKMNPGRNNPEVVRVAGPVDPEVAVVYFESADSEPVAMLVNFALHPAIVGGNHISADFPGVVCSLLSKVKGDEMVTVYTNGNSGNVNHIDVNWLNQPEGFSEATRVGTIVAADALKALSTLRPVIVNSLKVRSEPVEVPVSSATQKDYEWAKLIIASYSKAQSLALDDLVRAWRIIDLFELKGGVKARHEITTTVPLKAGGGALVSEIQAIILGDELALVGFPGDAFVELGLAIKQNSPYPYTVVTEQSGNGTFSYVPNYKAVLEGGYESESARFLPGGGEILVDTVIRVLTDFFPYNK